GRCWRTCCRLILPRGGRGWRRAGSRIACARPLRRWRRLACETAPTLTRSLCGYCGCSRTLSSGMRCGRGGGRCGWRGAAGPGSVQPAHRVDKGAVTEEMVRQAARAGARLVLGRRAVLTPLARDRARAAGVEIERER